ncbi:MAG: DUF4249 domain-containing protein [Muribaculaceae bacterium]|nr:DUF4249 domain-containing protein [Muribaculaceae bacterium]
MAILRHIIIISLPVLLTGCFEDFTPDIDTEPVLCLNSLITAGEPIVVQVSHTWLYTDEAAGRDHSVKDAVISIFANDEPKDADYLPQEGDCIRIVAESKTYGYAEAEVTVPYAVPIEAVKWEPVLTNILSDDVEGYEMAGHFLFNVRAELDINDPVGTEDYYRFSYLSFFNDKGNRDDIIYSAPIAEPEVEFNMGTFNYESEPIFSEHIGVFESVMGGSSYGFTFFTDRQFTGSTYTLHVQYSDCEYYVASQQWKPELLNCGYEFTLHTISKSYYDWANYMWQRDDGPLGDISEFGFGDPIWGYSNVSTGAGVVAAQSYLSCRIYLNDFLDTVLKEH